MVAGFGDCLLKFITDLTPRICSSLPVSLLTDLTIVLIAVVGGGALLLFALGLVICLVKKK